jgi:predicted amidohydrolase YtcJ
MSGEVGSLGPVRRGRVWLKPVGVSILGLALSACSSSRNASPPPDTIFAGTFVTLDPALPRVDALAVAGGRIVARGSRAEIARLAGGATQTIEVPGVGVPGWADAHVHTAEGGPGDALNLRGLTKPQILEAVSKVAQSTPPGDILSGDGWDEGFFTPPVFPTAADLDAVSRDHPVVLGRIDGHSSWVNTRVLEASGITRATADPPGGRVVRSRSGDPTGVLVDRAQGLIKRLRPDDAAEHAPARMRAMLDQFARLGYTSVHPAGVDLGVIAAYKELIDAGGLPVRVYAMARGDAAVKHYLQQGPEPDIGHGLLSVRSFKFVIDGALGSRGAELTTPYADDPGTSGLSMFDDAALDTYVRDARAKGFQVNVHAIGDKAVRRVLDAFERGGVTREDRFRIEHASVIAPADVPRFARLGVIASMQPVFVGEYARWAVDRLGPERLQWVLPFRDLLATGAVVACGSDFGASDTGNPIYTLSALVAQTGADGGPPGGFLPAQRVDVDTSLRCMSTGPAFAAFQEKDLGALTVGRYADFTAISSDPYNVPAGKVRDLTVRMTVMGGRVRFDASEKR